jgi:hypothetical protein
MSLGGVTLANCVRTAAVGASPVPSADPAVSPDSLATSGSADTAHVIARLLTKLDWIFTKSSKRVLLLLPSIINLQSEEYLSNRISCSYFHLSCSWTYLPITMSTTNTALVVRVSDGQSPRLSKESIPRPRPAANQVLVKISHVAQNPTDGMFITPPHLVLFVSNR